MCWLLGSAAAAVGEKANEGEYCQHNSRWLGHGWCEADDGAVVHDELIAGAT